MKQLKKFIFFCLLLATFHSYGQSENNYVLFAGNVKNTNETVIKISNLNGDFSEEFPIDNSGNFNVRIDVDRPGAYYYQIGKSYTTFYLKNGYNINLDIDAEEFWKSIKYSGNGSEINNYLATKTNLKGELVGDTKEFFVVPLDQFLEKIEFNKKAFLSLLEGANFSEEEKKLQRKIIETDYLLTKNNYDRFYFYHKKEHPELPIDYYNPIKEIDLNDDELFYNDKNYRSLLIEQWRLNSKEAMDKDQSLTIINFVKDQIKDIKNTEIQDYIAIMLLREINKDNANIDQDYQEILSILTDLKLKEKLTARYNSIGKRQLEMPSPDFNYVNIDGGTTTLKDLEGKMLYVEIWATWCAPCIKEMPALKELINIYKDQNIAFVSISIDSEKDFNKWRAMVPEKNVGGIQLYADKGLDSDFMKAFGVGLIPRSILLDENGKIINSHAPRPSDVDTKKYLDSLLNKNILRKLD
jgi:thiol-disulfide isomerase/thioredoxin